MNPLISNINFSSGNYCEEGDTVNFTLVCDHVWNNV